MKKYKQKLKKGTHIIALPINKKHTLDDLFGADLKGSYIEKMGKNGTFTQKEKVLLRNNAFIVSKTYKILKPLDIIRLSLKNNIMVNWDFAFKSYSYVKDTNLEAPEKYDRKQALQLMQICDLVYQDGQTIAHELKYNYKNVFDECRYFSEHSHKGFYKNSVLRAIRAHTSSKNKEKVVDLQFVKFIYFDNGKTIINFAFRGSQEREDWLTNLTVKKEKFFDSSEKVHQGFFMSAKMFMKKIKKERFYTKKDRVFNIIKDINFVNKNCKIVLTGHSLGGAIATLVGCRLLDLGIKKENVSIFTFGAPPVGSLKFVKMYEQSINIHRIINKKDIVPQIALMPLGLHHIGRPIVLNSFGGSASHSRIDYINNI